MSLDEKLVRDIIKTVDDEGVLKKLVFRMEEYLVGLEASVKRLSFLS